MAQEIPKASSGSTGLDLILSGGFPRERTTLLHGGTGTGKTIIGIQFLLAGAQNGEPGILISFEEQAASLRQNALSLGWDLTALENEGKLVIIDAMPDPKAVMTGGFDFTGLYSLLEGAIRLLKAKRIVIDAIDVLLQLLNDPAKEQNQIYQLHNWLSTHNITALLTAKLTANVSEYPFLEYLTDCVVRLMPLNEDRQRILHVIKFRGSDFVNGPHPYTIAMGGIILIPLAEVELQYSQVGGHVTTGLTALDEMMDGGYRKGSCIVIAGASGTGKTTFACQLAAVACKNNERVLYINYEESAMNIVAMMKSSGLDLEVAIRSDHLRIVAKMPEAMGPDDHLYKDIEALQEHKAQYLIIDAISACKRIASDTAANSYLFRLLNYCRKNGITALLTNQITGFQQAHEIYGIGFSSFVDTIIFLDYVQIGGELNRTLLIMKSRGSGHSNQYREFLITSQGIRFMDVYTGKGGMLTGVARLEQEFREQLESRLREQAIEAKKKEIDRIRCMAQIETSSSEAQIEKATIELKNLKTEDEISQEARKCRELIRNGTTEEGSLPGQGVHS
jgi:circadian clock protein KaiC